jgi:hypothetical protein
MGQRTQSRDELESLSLAYGLSVCRSVARALTSKIFRPNRLRSSVASRSYSSPILIRTRFAAEFRVMFACE